jgi:hypothetical protein
MAPGAVNVTLGASELLPAVAILPFMLYQLAGFGTLHFIVSRPVNWVINFGILGLIIASYIANRQGVFGVEKTLVGVLVVVMAITVFYGVLELKRMQTTYDANCPPKPPK